MYIIYRMVEAKREYLTYDYLGFYWTAEEENAMMFEYPAFAVCVAEIYGGDVRGA